MGWPGGAQCTYYVYLVRCANGTLYTGYTKNVERRIAEHNAGRGGRYTRINRPVVLIAKWSFPRKVEAIQAERIVKRLSRERKTALANSLTLDITKYAS